MLGGQVIYVTAILFAPLSYKGTSSYRSEQCKIILKPFSYAVIYPHKPVILMLQEWLFLCSVVCQIYYLIQPSPLFTKNNLTLIHAG